MDNSGIIGNGHLPEIRRDQLLVDPQGFPVTVGTDGNVHRVADPVFEAAKRNWNDLHYLAECYHNFLKAVQMNAPKDYQYADATEWLRAGRPCWRENDTFTAWCVDQMAMLDYRLDELERKFKGRIPSDRNLIHMLDKVDNPHPMLGHQLTIEDYEIMEWMLRKAKETLHKHRQGAYNFQQIVNYANQIETGGE